MTIPTSVVTDIASSTAALANGSTSLIIMLFGIGVAFYVGRNVREFFPK